MIDQSTVTASRGHFARICVEVDFAKRLLPKFKLKKRIRRIEYEGIHLERFHCGVYGHRKETCPKIVIEKHAEGVDGMNTLDANGNISIEKKLHQELNLLLTQRFLIRMDHG